jgi:hypothetical protein
MAPTLAELDATGNIRSIAYAVLGLSRPEPALLTRPLNELLRVLADRLLAAYADRSDDGWRWFEDELTYDNARLPQALIAAGHRLRDEPMIAAGLETLTWYAGVCQLGSPVLRVVGNRWLKRADGPGTVADTGDEQPLDVGALAEAYAEAMTATGVREYGRRAVLAFEWFLGRNLLGLPVYDFASGGCHDGLGDEELNGNEGAESTLAFLQARLALEGAGLQASLPRP